MDDATLLSPPPFAWTTNDPPGTWPVLPVTFVIALPRSRDVGADAVAELDAAARTWERVTCTSFRAIVAGERAVAPGDDGVNAVFFHDDAWPVDLVPDAVAQTVVHLDALGRLHDADIHLNGAAFRFSLDGAPGTQDLRSVLVHELGHALGLGHSQDPRATMYAAGSGLRWRSLEQDDRDGVCALYPGAGAPGCDVVPCPSPLVCVAGGCQRRGDRADVCSPCARVPDACEAAGDDARCVDRDGGGMVCGRACTGDVDCGAGFHCVATTASGDRQCVSDDGCRTAANTCARDADCVDASCVGGACVGGDAVGLGGAPDAAGSPADAGSFAGGLAASGASCGCRHAQGGTGLALPLAFAALVAVVRRRARPCRGRTSRR